jgi:hypothetical protein
VNDAPEPEINRPEPSACAAFVDPDANTINLSSTTSSVVLNVTVLPCTVKSPITVRFAPFTDIADFNDDVYEFIDEVDTFNCVKLISTLADLDSRLVNRVAADDVNEFTDAVPALNALILTC